MVPGTFVCRGDTENAIAFAQLRSELGAVKYEVNAFYKFVNIEDPQLLKEQLQELGGKHSLCGTILVAAEGINSTVAARPEDMRTFISALRSDSRFADLEVKVSGSAEKPFYRFKVRLKKEIVTLGVPGVDPVNKVGTYVPPQQWNQLIADPDVVVVDTRNDYEFTIGHFKGAVDPETQSFRQFPAWVEQNLKDKKKKKVAMYCTGGIRCEKATALLRQQGFEDVYHLQGGILKYLEEVEPEESLWQGSCFVFDNRVALQHGLEESDYINCPGCRQPLAAEDRNHPKYEEGVACAHCADSTDSETLANRRERHRQMQLARARGEVHIGRKVD